MKCEVCSEEEVRYRCPCCKLRTCSLPCVNKHKTDNNCNGTRNKTSYVAMKTFNDITLLNDYRFLEDAGRKADSANRDKLKYRHNRPRFMNQLQHQCRLRNTRLIFMPFPMSRRKDNTTYYNGRLQLITWYIQWQFPESSIKLTDKISELTILEDALQTHIHPTDSNPVTRQSLRRYVTAGLKGVAVFMREEQRPANDPRYHELNLSQNLKCNFADKRIVEYPTLYAVLEEQAHQYRKTSISEEVNVLIASSSEKQENEECMIVKEDPPSVTIGDTSDSDSDSSDSENSCSATSSEHSKASPVTKSIEEPGIDLKATPLKKSIEEPDTDTPSSKEDMYQQVPDNIASEIRR